MNILGKYFLTSAIVCVVSAADKGWKLPPETAKFEKSPGVEVVTAQCSLCHSADYISIQPPMSRTAWTATVTKMRERYGAPIVTDNVDQIVTYLVKTYGTERAK